MHNDPSFLLDPVFHFLDDLIKKDGDYLYMAAVYAAPFLIAWILSGGFWRRPRQQGRKLNSPPVIRKSANQPPPIPPIVTDQPTPRDSEDDIQSFAA
jgi:hypothetical protein